MKVRYIGDQVAWIEGRRVEPGDIVDIKGGTVVQTADVCDDPLFEVVAAPVKKATTATKEGK